MEGFRPTRRWLLRFATAAGTVAAINACAPSPRADGTPFSLFAGTPTPIVRGLPPEMSVFSILTRLSPDQIVGMSAVGNAEQQQFISALLIENGIQSAGGEVAMREEAKAMGLTIGKAGCSDSRVCGPLRFPFEVDGRPIREVIEGHVIEVSRVGAQPSVFEGTAMSVFSPHETCIGAEKGCGLLGGIDVILTQGKEGEELLKSKGISQLTIDEINNVIAMGANSKAKDWSLVGARIQADMNAFQNRISHYVMYGVEGHADGAFKALGIVDDMGNVYDVKDPRFRLLKSYADFINQPHAILEEVAAGQSPRLNLINLSRDKSAQDIVGRFARSKGEVFKSDVLAKVKGLPLTADESLRLLGGNDFSLAHLPQRENIILVTADTEADLATFRTVMFTEGRTKGAIDAFLKSGGVILETLVDETGKFTGMIRARTAESMGLEMNALVRMLKGIVKKDIPITPALIEEAKAISQAEFAAGKADLSVTERAGKLWSKLKTAARPLGPVLRFAGDTATLYQLLQFITKDVINDSIKGYDIKYVNIAKTNETVFMNEERVKEVIKNFSALREKHGTKNAYLIEGAVRRVDISQARLVTTYAQAHRAYMEWGPHPSPGHEPMSPWKDFDTETMLGKALIIEVPTTQNEGIEQHITFLTVRPEQIDSSGTHYFSDRDANQSMELDDGQTGFPIFGSIKAPPRIIATYATSHPDTVYLWQLVANPKEKKFEMTFIEALPIQQ